MRCVRQKRFQIDWRGIGKAYDLSFFIAGHLAFMSAKTYQCLHHSLTSHSMMLSLNTKRAGTALTGHVRSALQNERLEQIGYAQPIDLSITSRVQHLVGR